MKKILWFIVLAISVPVAGWALFLMTGGAKYYDMMSASFNMLGINALSHPDRLEGACNAVGPLKCFQLAWPNYWLVISGIISVIAATLLLFSSLSKFLVNFVHNFIYGKGKLDKSMIIKVKEDVGYDFHINNYILVTCLLFSPFLLFWLLPASFEKSIALICYGSFFLCYYAFSYFPDDEGKLKRLISDKAVFQRVAITVYSIIFLFLVVRNLVGIHHEFALIIVIMWFFGTYKIRSEQENND